MRSRGVLVVLALVVLAPWCSSPVSASDPACAPTQRDVVAETSRVVLFRVHGELWGCERGVKGDTFIADSPSEEGDGGWSQPVIAGDWAATIVDFGSKCSELELTRVNLRTGEIARDSTVSTFSPSSANACDDSAPVEVLRMRRDGSAASIAATSETEKAVLLVGGGVLARSATIDPASLHWTTDGLRWQDAAGDHTSPVAPRRRGSGVLSIRRTPSTSRANIKIRDRTGRVTALRRLQTLTALRLPAGSYTLRVTVPARHLTCEGFTQISTGHTNNRTLIFRTKHRKRCALRS